MNKYGVRILGAFIGLASLGITAKSQPVDELVVNIPFEFVAAGKTLPAGSYKVGRISDGDVRELFLRGLENHHDGVLFRSGEVNDRLEDKPGVSFQEVGGRHLLSKIETLDHVFTIPVSIPGDLETAKKTPGASGSRASGSK